MEGNKGREWGGTTNPQLFGKLAIYTNAHAPNRATGEKKKDVESLNFVSSVSVPPFYI